MHKVVGAAGVVWLVALAGCAPSATRVPVRVNQTGYLPDAAKVAIVDHEASTPLGWEVRDAKGSVVASGSTRVKGDDAESGDHVHWVDFSEVREPGADFVLVVDGEKSFPFEIGRGLYHQLKYDALAYFYHNRSGIPIEEPYVDKKHTRHAGHVSDRKVTCANRQVCAYSLDVSGGWYDAGDHGKYVVNGGISTWTLFNLYERTQQFGTTLSDFADGKLSIPEGGNGQPDLLDEARWEMEFLLRMEIPKGLDKAGMAHHKIHDSAWSWLGIVPPEEAKYRFLHPPSTAATLNLAATAAQCARIFSSIDTDLSRRCRAAAVRAWNAAQRYPDVYAPSMDNQGGGAYDDRNVTDEFYWAAAELYVTLGNDALLEVLRQSPHHGLVPTMVGHEGDQQHTSMTWQSTATLGAISLITVPSDLPATDRAQLRGSLLAAADEYLTMIDAVGYRIPMMQGTDGNYPWGSNSFVANNAIILALAHDLTGKQRYLDGVVEAVDYLMGKNPLNLSYVSFYGENYFFNPHHRFWAHGKAMKRPEPPPGCLAGGPNSNMQDPTMKNLRAGCQLLKCYIDHYDSWSTNEVAINWNAPLSWLAAFLDEKGQAGKLPVRGAGRSGAGGS
jgi:endoglucanase